MSLLSLPPAIIDQIVQAVAAAAWNRPELTWLREPVEGALRADTFRSLTTNAFQTLAETSAGGLPQFFDASFITMPAVQEALAAYVVKGEAADVDKLAELYAKRYLKPADAPNVQPQLAGYLRQMRETFAADPTYGPILLARDMQSMTAALNNLRGETQAGFAAVLTRLDALLKEPEIKALVERKSGAHIFLSYSRKNLALALQIRNALEDAGHTVWQDTSSIKTGKEWIDSIEDGIDRAYAVVSIVSAEARESEWVTIEFLHAKRRKKLIAPIKIDDCEIPTMMLALNVAHAHPDFAGGLHKLLTELPPVPAVKVVEKLSAVDRRQLEIDYLDRVLLEYSIWQTVYTPMAGVGQMRVESGDGDELEIVTTATAIEASFLAFVDERLPERPSEVKQRQYDDILPALEEMRQVVLLGDPGAGKTTTLWRIAADAAARAKTDPTQPLPVFVRLGEISGSQTLETALRTQLGVLGTHYDELIGEGRLALLLDGLNELSSAVRAGIATEARQWVEHFQKANGVIVLTCRELDYTGALDMGIAERVVISPLDPVRIRQFVNAYIAKPAGKGDELFWGLAGEVAKGKWERFVEAVGDDEQTFWLETALPEGKTWGWDENQTKYLYWEQWLKQRYQPRSLLTLASNPYLLFMITRVFTGRKGSLPSNRGALFSMFVDYLLLKREGLDAETAANLKAHLAGLAYAMQARGEGTTFSQEAVTDYLDEQQLYRALSASILSGNDELRFTHQLLQEYFAAQRLDAEMKQGTSAAQFWPSASWWQPQRWDETAILLAGLYSDDTTPVIEWLREANPKLTVQCVIESGAQTPKQTIEALRPDWLRRLTDVSRNPQPQARAIIGRALGLLNLDDRPGVGLRPDGLPDMAWCEVPPDEYPIGGDKEAGQPKARKFKIKVPYYISRYPITYRQFQAFVDAPDGFHNPDWWRGLSTDDDHKREPGDQAFKFWNHPRERVSWYDAVAFCRWLSVKLDYEVRLPTEYEWEAAARGKEGRFYPYGNDFDTDKANTVETLIRQTSAVGIFPEGASPFGVEDMSGNVWEWCLNVYKNPERISVEGTESRVVRGGSWFNFFYYARAPYRNYYFNPLNRNNYLGFRVVCAAPLP